MIRRLILWWRILLDRETRDTTQAAWLANLRRELYETERERDAHLASYTNRLVGRATLAAAQARHDRLQARVDDLRARIQEHA